MKKLALIFFFFLVNISLAQHGFGPEWGPEILLPRYNESLDAKQRGVLYNNMVVTSNGRIIISTSELNKSNINQIYGHYLCYSDDGGLTWSNPKRFTPTDLVIGGSSVKLAMNSYDTLYVLWNSVNPSAIFISILDSNLNVIKDSVRVASKMTYGNFATHLTIDRKNRIHVMWHEGEPLTSKIAESFYTRSTDGGLTWDSVKQISSNDGHHSAFPHAQFDNAGDTLMIAWRDSVGGPNKWDVVAVFSSNGGSSWSTPKTILGSPDYEWDPDVLIDPSNRIHLFYTKYSRTDPFFLARNYYQYSDNFGLTWNLPSSPINGMISAPYRSQLIEGTRYDELRNILYVTWKDERDFDTLTGEVKGDIMLAYSTNRGLNWSEPEFITDRYDSSIGFKAGAIIPTTGEYCVNYEVISKDDISDPTTSLRVYFRKRNSITTNVFENNLSPNYFTLFQNYPNPFNPKTTIAFQLSESGLTTLKIFDALGRELKTLVNENLTAGNYYEYVFDASDFASGIYFAQLTNNNQTLTRKLLLMK